jgi:hypothetical protein
MQCMGQLMCHLLVHDCISVSAACCVECVYFLWCMLACTRGHLVALAMVTAFSQVSCFGVQDRKGCGL